jgi:hypothetical protein
MPVLANDHDGLEPMKRLPLDGVRVVECGDGVAAAFATKLMALLGAEVIKVESPQGDSARFRGPFFDDRIDPEASGLFLYLNADKSSVSLDLRAPSDRARLDELLAAADILVHNIPPRERASFQMESPIILAAHPDLIVTGISAYGDYGPRAQWRAYELNMIHAGGVAALAPLCSKLPEMPPLKLYGQQAEFQAANHAAFATLAAWFHRITGRNGVEPVSRSPELVEGRRVREVHTASGASDSKRRGTGQVIEVSACSFIPTWVCEPRGSAGGCWDPGKSLTAAMESFCLPVSRSINGNRWCG